MCVWNIGLHEEKNYHVFGIDMEVSTSSEQGQAVSVTGTKRRVREWVTDAIYLNNCHHIAIASTGRDIRFFDTATSTQIFEEFCLFGKSLNDNDNGVRVKIKVRVMVGILVELGYGCGHDLVIEKRRGR